jgi:hypothetical protein
MLDTEPHTFGKAGLVVSSPAFLSRVLEAPVDRSDSAEGASVRPLTKLLRQLAALHRLELADVPDDR